MSENPFGITPRPDNSWTWLGSDRDRAKILSNGIKTANVNKNRIP